MKISLDGEGGEGKIMANTPYLVEESTFGGHLLRPIPRKDQGTINLTIHPMPFTTPRRYMHTRPTDIAENLNAQIERYAERAALALGMSISDFGNAGIATPSKITVVGRVINELEGKLTERGILLESSRQMGSGCRVPLEIGANIPVSLFPGQIVILEGNNTDGSTFHVSSQKIPSILSQPAPKVNSIIPFTMMVACGPFTMDSDGDKLDFEPLEKLLNLVYDQRPNLLILMGPFIDAEHSAIKKGRLSAPFAEIFQRDFLGRIKMVTSRATTLQVIMVSSTRDLLADNVYPQPSFSISDLTLSIPNVTYVSNPSIINVNDLNISINSSDVLLPLGMEEYHRNANNTDRMQRLCSYLHSQASFFPLHPAPNGTNIDYGLLSNLELKVAPDIWLSSSQLRYFAKEFDGTLHVNSGQFCRKQARGTAAFLTITNTGDKRVDFYQF